MTPAELSEIIRNYGIVAGGGIGLVLAWWRGVAHSRQAKAQQDQATIAQRTYTTGVFKDAVEQLGHEKLEVRLGAVFTLKRIAYDFPEFDGPVLELLTAYVRERAGEYAEEQTPGIDILEILKFIQGNQAKV